MSRVIKELGYRLLKALRFHHSFIDLFFCSISLLYVIIIQMFMLSQLNEYTGYCSLNYLGVNFMYLIVFEIVIFL